VVLEIKLDNCAKRVVKRIILMEKWYLSCPENNEAKVHATPSKTPSLLLQIAGALLQVDKNMLDYCFTGAVNWSISD
jgi:hypothetical protein